MKKTSLGVSLLLIIILLLCACDNSKANSKKETPTGSGVSVSTAPTTNEHVVLENIVDDAKFKADLENENIIKNGYISCKYVPQKTYTIDSLTIVKRQTNLADKQDVIFCNVVIENGYFETTYDLKVEYNFYDVGGWILDEAKIEKKNSVPISGVDESMIVPTCVSCSDEMYDTLGIDITSDRYSYDLNKFQLKKHDTDVENMNDSIFYIYADKHFEMEADVGFYFDQNEGWKCKKDYDGDIYLDLKKINIDWDMALDGIFIYYTDNWQYVLDRAAVLELSGYDEGRNLVNINYYDISYRTMLAEYSYDKTIVVDKESFSLSFYYKTYINMRWEDWKAEFFYDFILDEWRGAGRYYRATKDITFDIIKTFITAARDTLMFEWCCEDFDGDGKKEAFITTGDLNTYNTSYGLKSLWYVSDTGYVECIIDEEQYWYFVDEVFYFDNCKLLYVDGRHFYRSVIGVKNDQVIEINVEGDFEWIGQKEDTKELIAGQKRENIVYILNFDYETMTFVKTGETFENSD